jgi:hypothetical protein
MDAVNIIITDYSELLAYIFPALGWCNAV